MNLNHIALIVLAMLPSLASASEKPNMIVIMSDDSGYTDLGCYGGEVDTPHIDELAAQGIRLSNFYSNGRCSPTRASLLSGLECAKVGFGGGSLGDWSREMPFPAHRGRLPYQTPLLPEVLKNAGYHTMMSGKWHLGGSLMRGSKSMQEEWSKSHPGWELTESQIESDFLGLPSQRGFDEYFGLYGAQDNFFVVPGQSHRIMEGNQPAKLRFERTYSMHCYTDKSGGRYGRNHGKTAKAFYDTDGVTDRAIEMIQGAAGKDKPPFFLYVAYRAPHKPLQAPEKLVQKYLPRYQDLGKVATDRITKLKEEQLFPGSAGARKRWTPQQKLDSFRLQLAVHAAMVEKVDENVGRLINALKASGEHQNSLIIYLSDNGCASHVDGFMNTPYFGSKALVWEGGTKTHFIAAWPQHIKPGTVSDNQAWVGDVLPTCLEVAGLDYPETFREKKTTRLDGRSMLSTLMGESAPAKETLFFNDKGQQSVIYQGRWKLLIEPGWYLQTLKQPGVVRELYDLVRDPAETTNVADAHPELVQQLSALCETWKQDSGIVDYAEIIKLRPQDPF
ncbi:Arylsulfatase [Rubripirellula amarantea]|uniref:Arylsulfatase n=1 Tax=Rubripirellula amarantea TaxID=2527999 RepID=A0A5C5WGZ2_9BACT|nr:sulfatase-like hydrolase/transferase [Rubripirellula amarantea]TWT49381.1 Arylsulfatase [Rubripirellula amarantea]